MGPRLQPLPPLTKPWICPHQPICSGPGLKSAQTVGEADTPAITESRPASPLTRHTEAIQFDAVVPVSGVVTIAGAQQLWVDRIMRAGPLWCGPIWRVCTSSSTASSSRRCGHG